jgi:hypothetical protein
VLTKFGLPPILSVASLCNEMALAGVHSIATRGRKRHGETNLDIQQQIPPVFEAGATL